LAVVCWLSLFQASAAADEESSLQRLFEGVRRGASAPELIRDTFGTDAEDSQDESQDGSNGQGTPKAQKNGRLVSDGGQGRANADVVETLPPPRVEGTLPLSGWDAAGNVELQQSKGWIGKLVVRDASLSHVLSLLAQTQELNIVASNDIDATISITLRDVPLEEALTAILSVANYTWVRKNNIILITSLADAARLPANVQGRQIQVFEIDFASADEVASSVEGFLSPIGKVTVSEIDSADSRRTRELVIVEDLPESLVRIAAYVQCVDRPPRQVQIEAHILQVDLNDVNRHGVNFEALFRIAGETLTLETRGFANPLAPQAFFATLEGGDLELLVEMLQTTTDTKTLGSPKLLVLNGQEARMQVGEQLGFRVTTTTETSTLESVQFLDVGVVLRIIPQITRDGRVLLYVRPEVSSGEVNPETGLPEEETTQLETAIMLEDGQGMIVGGLIRETDSVLQSKVPYLGNIWGIGNLFKKSEVTKNRVEVIISIVPRIQPYDAEWHNYQQGELAKAGVPLFHKDLRREQRPWDPVLPDGVRVGRPLCPFPSPTYDTRPPFRTCGPDYYTSPHPLPTQNLYDTYCDPDSEYPLVVPEVGPETYEALPPQSSNPSWQGVEIVSDQN
jgi:type II secretory pathway component HofQ